MREYLQRLGVALINQETAPTDLIKGFDARYKLLQRQLKENQREWRNLLVKYERVDAEGKVVTDQRDAFAALLQKTYKLFEEEQRFNRDIYNALDKQADRLEETLKRKVPTW